MPELQNATRGAKVVDYSPEGRALCRDLRAIPQLYGDWVDFPVLLLGHACKTSAHLP